MGEIAPGIGWPDTDHIICLQKHGGKAQDLARAWHVWQRARAGRPARDRGTLAGGCGRSGARWPHVMEQAPERSERATLIPRLRILPRGRPWVVRGRALGRRGGSRRRAPVRLRTSRRLW